jgi:hypothetical protein
MASWISDILVQRIIPHDQLVSINNFVMPTIGFTLRIEIYGCEKRVVASQHSNYHI